jgi:hypothetical protein
LLIYIQPTASLAGAILSTEARQAAWIGATVFRQNPWNTPFEVTYPTFLPVQETNNSQLLQNPLNFRQIYTLTKPYIVSCPENQPYILGFNETFPTLSVTLNPLNTSTTSSLNEPPPNPTATFNFTLPSSNSNTTNAEQQPQQQLYAAFIQGNGTQFAPIDSSTGTVELPEGLSGYLYALVTSEMGVVSDVTTVAGPTVLEFPFNSRGEGLVDF